MLNLFDELKHIRMTNMEKNEEILKGVNIFPPLYSTDLRLILFVQYSPFPYTWSFRWHWDWPTVWVFFSSFKCKCGHVVCGWRSFPVTSMFFTCWRRWWSVPCAALWAWWMTGPNRADKHRRPTTQLASALTVTELASNRLWQGAVSTHTHTHTQD